MENEKPIYFCYFRIQSNSRLFFFLHTITRRRKLLSWPCMTQIILRRNILAQNDYYYSNLMIFFTIIIIYCVILSMMRTQFKRTPFAPYNLMATIVSLLSHFLIKIHLKTLEMIEKTLQASTLSRQRERFYFACFLPLFLFNVKRIEPTSARTQREICQRS